LKCRITRSELLLWRRQQQVLEPRKESLGEIRIKEAIGTSAVIATACPCIRMLNESIAKLGVGDR
jgi:hypothetical protein